MSAADIADAGTVTFFPSGGTHSVPIHAPDPVVVSARMTRLRDAGWLDVRRCGGGGMGELFDGFDPGIQRQVVAKFIRRDAISDSTRDRFRVEATTLARLEDKNVARLFAYNEGSDPYLVMEYVEGGSLSERIRAGALPAREAAAILEGVARGVAVAHANGVVHRDLKPSNVLLDRSGAVVVPKVTDFGMAKDVDAVEPLTGSNAVLGTPEFMSPEQAASRSATCDARSDVWGLAATLYSAVTGHPPYTRDLLNPPVLTDPLTPPTAHTPDLPADLAAVITMGLEKHPNDRYQTAAAFAEDLERFLTGKPVVARRRAWPIRVWRRAQRVSTGTAVAVLFAVAALATVGAMYFDREPTPDEKLARKMAQLARGATATLVPDTGPPVWTERAVGTFTPTLLNATGGTWGVTSMEGGVCQVCPAVPLDTYRLSMELCEVSAPAPRGNATHRLGVVVGMERFPGFPDGPLARGLTFWFQDLDPRKDTDLPPVENPLAAELTWFIERPGRSLATPSARLVTRKFHPSRSAAATGRWRKFDLAVSPAGVRLVWTTEPAADGTRPPALEMTIPAAEINARAASHLQSLHDKFTPTPLPAWTWNPNGGIGVLVSDCIVGVRNVTLAPP